MARMLLSLITVTILASGFGAAQKPPDPKDDQAGTHSLPTEERRLLVATSVETFADQLNKFSRRGYCLERVVFDTSEADKRMFSSGLNRALGALKMVAILRTCSTLTAETTYEYQILLGQSADQIEKQLNEAAQQGWRLRSLRGIVYAFKINKSYLYDAISISLLERQSGQSAQRWLYRVRPSVRKAAMKKNVAQSLAEGFRPVEFTFSGEARWYSLGLPMLFSDIVFERPAGETPSDRLTDKYEVISTVRLSAMVKDINAATKKGLRVEHFSRNGHSAIMSVQHQPAGAIIPHYLISELQTREKGFARAFAEEVSRQASKGLKYCCVTNNTRAIFFEDEQKAAPEPPPRYKVISDPDATDESNNQPAQKRPELTDPLALQRSLNEALSAGFRVCDLVYASDTIIIILEKNYQGSHFQ